MTYIMPRRMPAPRRPHRTAAPRRGLRALADDFTSDYTDITTMPIFTNTTPTYTTDMGPLTTEAPYSPQLPTLPGWNDPAPAVSMPSTATNWTSAFANIASAVTKGFMPSGSAGGSPARAGAASGGGGISGSSPIALYAIGGLALVMVLMVSMKR